MKIPEKIVCDVGGEQRDPHSKTTWYALFGMDNPDSGNRSLSISTDVEKAEPVFQGMIVGHACEKPGHLCGAVQRFFVTGQFAMKGGEAPCPDHDGNREEREK